MTLIDWRDSRPIYEQIVDRIKRLIIMDVLQPGEQLPSVRSLAMENGTNPNTVQKAYAELERQGVTYTVRGRGVFVSETSVLKDKKRMELIESAVQIFREGEELHIGHKEIYDEAVSRLQKKDLSGKKVGEDD
ncbi:MAG: GntR family transcriptional regulator [Lachnospiraceae bacterium]|nr:GntR family transcriptional regulator [Lachnospiraceae bacterium]